MKLLLTAIFFLAIPTLASADCVRVQYQDQVEFYGDCAPSPAPIVIVQATPAPHRHRYYRTDVPYYHQHYYRDDYAHRHPKTTEARTEHHRRTYHKTADRRSPQR